MKNSVLKLTALLAALCLFATATSGCGMCAKEVDSQETTKAVTNTTTKGPTTAASSSADLTIAAVEVGQIEGQPVQAGKPFRLNIYVKNIGVKASGEYDVKIYIQDVSRGSTYPVGTFRQRSMQPGEQWSVYSSVNRMVNFPGTHKVVAEVVPFLWTETNLSNNLKEYSFTVVQ